MKRTFKKAVSVFLVVAMLLCAAPLNGFVGLDLPSLFDFRAEAASYSGTCGDNLTWSFDTETGVLDITGTGAMTDWWSSNNIPWYSYRDSIKTVNIANGVTSIGDYAFYNCSSLTSVTIGNSVKSIGSYVFRGCTSLTNITIDKSNTAYSSDEYGVLFNKDKTQLIQYPIGNERTSYTIPDSVTSIGSSAFEDCTSLTSITIPDSVTSIGYSAFEDCTSLTSITIPDSVTSISDSSFSGCTSLTSVIIPDSVTSIVSYAFYNCSSLASVTIPDSVTSIGYSAFFGCTSLTSITIPDSVTGIGSYAFYNCSSLASVTIPDSVTSIGNSAFSGCTNLTGVTIGNSVTSISDSAFYNCSGLLELTMPVSAKIYNSSNTFYNCTNIKKLTLTKGDGTAQGYGTSTSTSSSTTYYQYTPWYLSRAKCTEVIIEDGVTDIGNYMFYGCTGITELTIPASAKIYNSSNTFYNCTNIEKLTITKGNGTFQNYGTSTSTSLSTTYYQYTPWYLSRAKCTEVIIEDGVTGIGDYMFYNCAEIDDIVLPFSVESIGINAFAGCQKLGKLKVYNRNCVFESNATSYYTTIVGYSG